MTVVEDAYGQFELVNDRNVVVWSGFATRDEAWKWLDDNFEPVHPWQWYSEDGFTVMDGLTLRRERAVAPLGITIALVLSIPIWGLIVCSLIWWLA